jgi:hypothetical protein
VTSEFTLIAVGFRVGCAAYDSIWPVSQMDRNFLRANERLSAEIYAQLYICPENYKDESKCISKSKPKKQLAYL